MLLTVYCVRRDLSEVTFSLQVDADFELHNFRALCELESGIPAAESQIVYAERPLTDNHRSLASYGLKDGDVVILRQKENADPRPSVQFPNLPRIDFSSIAVPGTSGPRQRQPPGAQQRHPSPGEMAASPQGLDNPALLRDMLLANPHELSLLKERNPPLAEALLSGDLEKFSRVLVEQQQDRARREQERIRLFSADPFDLEAQAKIEEDIRQQNIEENMTIAMEEAPESFGQVVMLYINCKVNGHPVKAFVDSGAQMTIMSQACAERCNIMRLVDRRWAGIAKGVGTQKIIGRVHLAQVQIEGDFLACSFSILEEQPMDMLLGLDMLKRHQCSIDLKKNVLVIGTTGSQTTFLPEGELPECARLAYGTGREDLRPEEIADQELAEAIQKSAEDAEKSGKESTSLGASSLPTSDGFTRPAPSPGQRPGGPTSLTRSVSASACPVEPSDPDNTDPAALEALKASAEFQINSHEKEYLPRQGLGDLASSGDQSPAMPSQNSSEETFAASDLEKSTERSAQSLRFSLHTRQEVHSSLTTTRIHEPLTLTGDKDWHPGNQNPSQENGLQHKEPGSTQQAAGQQKALCDLDHLRDMEDLELHEEGQQDQVKVVSVEVTEGLQEIVRLTNTEQSFLPSGRPGSASSETLMEVDVVEQSLVTLLGSAGGQSAGGRSASESPLMEVEASRCDPASAQDLRPLGSNIEGDSSPPPSLSLCGSGQLSVESPEESHSSVTTALKELHELLVISCQSASENAPDDVVCQSELVAESQTSVQELSGRWTRREHLAQGDQRPHVSSVQASSESVETEDASPAPRAAAADAGSPGLGGPGLSADGIPTSRKPGVRTCSIAATSAQSPRRFNCTSGAEVAPTPAAGEGDAHSQTPEQGVLVRDLGQGSRDPVAGGPAAREDGGPGAARPLPEVEPPAGQPALAPAILPPGRFPATDIDRILRAGFTLQEAIGALHRVGGNADLALLVLLAKNIVVPT